MKTKPKITIDEQWRIVRQICAPLGINYEKMPTTKQINGVAVTEKNLILISERERTEDEIISLVLHEVMHVLASKTKKYDVFHNAPFYGYWTHDLIAVYKKTALFAELYVDKQAERAARKLFPHIRYNRSYRTKKDQEFLRRHVNGFAKTVLKALNGG